MSDLPEELAQIERMIASSKDYIVPSDNLRPRVLELARLRQSQMRSSWRMLQVAALVFASSIISIPAQQRLEAWRRSVAAPSSGELEIRAHQYAGQPSIGPNWGFYEAFQDLRQDRMMKILKH